MQFAIVNMDTNIVQSIAQGYVPLQSNWFDIPSTAPVSIGDKYENDKFYDPITNEIRRPATQQDLNSKANINAEDINTLLQALGELTYEVCLLQLGASQEEDEV